MLKYLPFLVRQGFKALLRIV